MKKATPQKLRDGTWGARVYGAAPQVGETITIETKSGKTWETKVLVVLSAGTFGGRETSLVKTESTARSKTGKQKGGVHCDECHRFTKSPQSCRDSSGLSGQCCPRCAAMPAYTRSFA